MSRISAGGLKVQGEPGPHNDFLASLGSCLKLSQEEEENLKSYSKLIMKGSQAAVLEFS